MDACKGFLLLVFFALSILPSLSATEQGSITKFSDYELMNKCPMAALKYVTGDKSGAQQLAKELLPSVEKNYEERHTFGIALNMLKAVVNNDDKAVENYMENNYDSQDISLTGFKFGLKETLAQHEKLLALVAAEPLSGPLSYNYLCEGIEVASMMYETGRKDQAKALSKELMPLLKRLKDENSEKLHSHYGRGNYTYEREEALLKGIINDETEVIVQHLRRDPNLEDSVGYRLEEAYGRIYLIKRLKMDLDHLAYNYNELGRAQAVAGNYDESERAYKVALRLAKERFEHNYPEIVLQIRSEYAAMLKVAGKADEAAKVAKGLTPEYLKEVEAKAHPDRLPTGIYGMPEGWGP